MRWIIGDIHGMLVPLAALLEEVLRLDPAAQLMFTGDYINRGPQSKQVIDLLLTLDNAKFLRGNHDDVFDEIVNGMCFCRNCTDGNRHLAYRWFMQHGLAATWRSYGVAEEDVVWAMREITPWALSNVTDAVPDPHRRFFRSLSAVIEEEDFFVVHGRWTPGDITENPPISTRVTLDLKRRQDMLWGRFESAEIDADKSWHRPGYFGHTPVDQYPVFMSGRELTPIVGVGMVLLDTAAAMRAYGRLTAWCHEEQTFVQADRQGRVVPRRSAAEGKR